MLLDLARDRLRVHEQAEFDVPFLRRFREVRGSNECLPAIDDHTLGMHRAGRTASGIERPRVVVHARQSAPRPLVAHKFVREVPEDVAINGGIAVLAADIDAKGCPERIVVVEPVSQRLEHGLPLTDRETNGQRSFTRPGEQLPHDDAGIACAAGCIRPTDNHFDRQ